MNQAKELKQAIVFIDGNNLYHNLKASFLSPGTINLRRLSELITEHFNCKLKDIEYFNSVPSIEDGKNKYEGHMKYLESLRKQGIEVKTRKLQRHSNQERIQIIDNEISLLGLCKACEPVVKSHWKDYIGSVSVKEKGIDIMIATAMIRHSMIAKDCNACILISGDADFIPCMEVIKSAGVWVATVCTAKGYSFQLRQSENEPAFPWFILDKDWLRRNCTKQ
ncbi:NYN domain-containing protein [Candidatus Woesearchaeota archaeon]|nr:NYN domain-containing protein [Candidatus Woesearchaeota archaeon]